MEGTAVRASVTPDNGGITAVALAYYVLKWFSYNEVLLHEDPLKYTRFLAGISKT